MNHKQLSHLLVALQILAIVICVFPFAKPEKNLAGLILLALGLISGAVTIYFNKLDNFSIYPELKPNTSLITEGPYRYIRHPMYTSLFVMMLGVAIYNSHYLNFIGLAILTLTLMSKAYIEESLLKKHFPTYADYMAKTKKFIPFIF